MVNISQTAGGGTRLGLDQRGVGDDLLYAREESVWWINTIRNNSLTG
jgi:hypothetical protein